VSAVGSWGDAPKTVPVWDSLRRPLAGGRKKPAGFSLHKKRNRLYVAQQREFTLMDKQQQAAAEGRRFGPRLERELDKLRERMDEIRQEILALEDGFRGGEP